MRKRNRLDSSAVQGEGSWVELRAPAWGAARAFLMADAGGDEQARGLAMMEELLPLCVAAWNWTDEAGEPLELPADVEKLTMDEVLWLVPHISGLLTPEKN